MKKFAGHAYIEYVDELVGNFNPDGSEKKYLSITLQFIDGPLEGTYHSIDILPTQYDVDEVKERLEL